MEGRGEVLTYNGTAALRMIQISEQLPQVRNVRFGIKLKRAGVCEKLGELTGASLAQLCNRYLLLLFKNQPVLLLRILGLEALPGQCAFQKVNKNIANGLEIIATTLLDAKVVINRGVTRSAREGASIAMWYMVKILGVAVSF